MLSDRWNALWKRIGAQGDADAVYSDLERRYCEPHRHYHTLLHIADGFGDLDTVSDISKNPDALEAAWFLHDSVYELLSKTNEQDSAQLGASIFSHAGVRYPLIRDMCRLVIVTDHKTPPVTIDEKIIVCNDLAMFGKPEETFDRYDSGIYQEYVVHANVPEDFYKEKRTEILSGFLDRSKHGGIYTIGYYKDRYEGQARKNLERAVKRLRE